MVNKLCGRLKRRMIAIEPFLPMSEVWRSGGSLGGLGTPGSLFLPCVFRRTVRGMNIWTALMPGPL